MSANHERRQRSKGLVVGGYRDEYGRYYQPIEETYPLNQRLKAVKNEDSSYVEGQHEGIISESLFYRVQDILDGKKSQ